MRTGLWFPVSGNEIGIAFIIAIVAIIIYAFYYNSKKGAIKKLEKTFNDGESNNDPRIQNIRNSLNVPTEIEQHFKNKKIDFTTNTLSYFTDGAFSFALCSHGGLKMLKVFFRIDFSNNPILHKISVIDENNEDVADIYLTAESMIFTDGNVRYYEVTWSDLQKISETARFKFSINGAATDLSHEETNQILNAIQYSLNLKSEDSHTLLARNE